MKVKYLEKTKSVLEDLIKCLNDRQRKGFYETNSNICSLMFDGAILKPDFSIILPNDAAGYFTNIMWNIRNTGAYAGNSIGGYGIPDIIKCVKIIVECIDKEIFKGTETDKRDFLTNLLSACSLMQNNYFCHDKIDASGKPDIVDEDFRNYYLRDLFDYKGLYVRGQEHQGVSPNGKGAGEVDLLICRTELQEKIYIECMNLHSLEATKINYHYTKLFPYDASMNENNYLVSYVTVSDFGDFFSKYKAHFEKYSGNNKCEKISEKESGFANIKILITESKINKKSIFTYHVLVFFEKYVEKQ